MSPRKIITKKKTVSRVAPKKAVKVAAQKKPTKRGVQTSRRESARSTTTLIRAQGGACFWIHDGPIICDIRDLQQHLSLGKITDAQWKHHVGPSHNHFAAWIKDVFRNVGLAEKFIKAKTKQEASAVLSTSLKS